MALPSAYLETTIISYLAARPSRVLLIAAHQQVTHEWWEERGRFELYISEAVRTEILRGDKQAAALRMALVQELPVLQLTEGARDLARRLIADGPIPPNAVTDAVHVATAAVHGIEFLVTWNCKHLANAFVRTGIESACRAAGFRPPIICTPEELKVMP